MSYPSPGVSELPHSENYYLTFLANFALSIGLYTEYLTNPSANEDGLTRQMEGILSMYPALKADIQRMASGRDQEA